VTISSEVRRDCEETMPIAPSRDRRRLLQNIHDGTGLPSQRMNSRDQRKMKRMDIHRPLAGAEILHGVVRPWIRFREQHLLDPLHFFHGRLRQIFALVPSRLIKIRHSVEAERRHAEVEPEIQDVIISS